MFDWKPRPSTARSPAPKPASRRPAQAPPVNPLWFRFATSNNVGAAASPEVTEERQRYFEPVLLPTSAPWSRIGRVASETPREAEAPQRGTPGSHFDFARVATVQLEAEHNASSPTDVHRIAAGGLTGSGDPLPHVDRIQAAFGGEHDLSNVHAHIGNAASTAARSIGAAAYAFGDHVAFRGAPDLWTAAHEATHVIQQRSGLRPDSGVGQSGDVFENQADAVADRIVTGAPVAGIMASLTHPTQLVSAATSTQRTPAVQRLEPEDAGVPPLPGGLPEPVAPEVMDDSMLGPALEEARIAANADRVEAIEAEMEKRTAGWGTAVPAGPGPVTTGVGAVTPDVALQLIENMSRGQPAFKPELGLGGCSWFTTEGNPYAATSPAKSINVPVEINKGSAPLVFKEADLLKIFGEEAAQAAAQAEAEYRAKFNIDPAAKLSNRARKAINRVLRGLTEKRMWTRVGEKVAASANKVGEVVLEPGSIFSENPGKFAVVADASKITLKGGIAPVVDALTKAGVTAEPAVVEAAEILASRMKWAGRVRAVFRVGGKVLIVVGVTMDLIRIYRAEEKWKATLTSVGGWAGATAAGAAFAAWFAPADTAGPWAWAAHGAGTLIAGGVGYWVGSETVRYIYELAVEP